jgi:hypothetical protein
MVIKVHFPVILILKNIWDNSFSKDDQITEIFYHGIFFEMKDFLCVETITPIPAYSEILAHERK